MAKNSVFTQIDVIENRKKVLVEFRENIEEKLKELFKSSPASKNPNDSAALLKFYEDAEKIKKNASASDQKFLNEVRLAQKDISGKRTVEGPSLELKVKFGTFDTFSNGWRFLIQLMNGEKLVYKTIFIVNYKNLVKKDPIDINASNDELVNEYVESIQKITSLIAKNALKLKFQLDFSVECASDDHDSEYEFYISELKIYENYDNLIQTQKIDQKVIYKNIPPYSVNPIFGIVEREKKRIAIELAKRDITDFFDNLNIGKTALVKGTDKIKPFEILTTPVTQNLYEKIMIENPSHFKGERRPVEMVSWFDAISFCNKLSLVFEKTPCYSLNGETNPDKWNYIPHNKQNLNGEIVWNKNANGFRLPTQEEWILAANGGIPQNSLSYSGSNTVEDVAWFFANSKGETHEVGLKSSNALGLYDMSGNVWEWCWDSDGKFRANRGGSWRFGKFSCQILNGSYEADPATCSNDLGFRYVCNA